MRDTVSSGRPRIHLMIVITYSGRGSLFRGERERVAFASHVANSRYLVGIGAQALKTRHGSVGGA